MTSLNIIIINLMTSFCLDELYLRKFSPFFHLIFYATFVHNYKEYILYINLMSKGWWNSNKLVNMLNFLIQQCLFIPPKSLEKYAILNYDAVWITCYCFVYVYCKQKHLGIGFIGDILRFNRVDTKIQIGVV